MPIGSRKSSLSVHRSSTELPEAFRIVRFAYGSGGTLQVANVLQKDLPVRVGDLLVAVHVVDQPHLAQLLELPGVPCPLPFNKISQS